jgi:MtN3 and saliva related transmembrane protein
MRLIAIKREIGYNFYMSVEILGFFAAFLTTSAFVPQAWKVLKEGHTKAISLPMYAIFSLGVACWLAYGICLGSWPIILSNSFTLVLAVYILRQKIRNRD